MDTITRYKRTKPPFQILDWVSGKVPHLSFSVRTVLLFYIILFSVMWAYGGWDSTVSSTLTGKNYGTGIHWSTGQTMGIVFYLLLINVQYRGIGARRMLTEIWLDVWMLALTFGLWSSRVRRVFKEINEFQRTESPQIDGVRAVIFSFLVMVAGLFAFENAWVLLYDLYHFGDLLWPIYWTQAYDGVPFYTYAFARNFLALVVTLPIAWLALKIPVNRWTHYQLSYRINRYAGVLFLITILAWGVWIAYPLPQNQRSLESLQATEVINPVWVVENKEQPEGKTFVELYGSAWVMPTQGQFPQTSYTFYPQAVYDEVKEGKGFSTRLIYGFHNDAPLVHGLNVLTKYLTMLAVAYPFMVKIR